MPALLPLVAVLAGAIPAPLTPGADLHDVYAGVRCRTANSVLCDRLGLSLQLRPRPTSVVAFIGGRRVPLRRQQARGPWSGSLAHAGFAHLLRAQGIASRDGYWAGADAPLIRAIITATFPDGHRETLPLLAPLSPGFC
ncbi:MAG TPA: hypothetical protein VGM91_15940 [Conexibacter sp.]|jgi:hypothetical protein